MTDRKNDIDALLNRAKIVLVSIKKNYNSCLQNKKVSSGLQIDIKDFCGHLRSILDYLARDVHKTFATGPEPSILYFPLTSSNADFRSRMTKNFNGLELSCNDLWLYLQSIQPYQDGYEWLSQLNQINNENKHKKLVEQITKERSETKVSSPKGGSVSWPSGVKFGAGVKVLGAPIDEKTQLPNPNSSVTVEKTIWVDFRFEGINVSAIDLLQKALTEIEIVVNKVYFWL